MKKFCKKLLEVIGCIALGVLWCILFFGGLLCVALFWGGP